MFVLEEGRGAGYPNRQMCLRMLACGSHYLSAFVPIYTTQRNVKYNYVLYTCSKRPSCDVFLWDSLKKIGLFFFSTLYNCGLNNYNHSVPSDNNYPKKKTVLQLNANYFKLADVTNTLHVAKALTHCVIQTSFEHHVI